MTRPRTLVLGFMVCAVLLPGWLMAIAALAQDATPQAPSASSGPAHLDGDLPGDPQIQLIQVAAGLPNPVNIAFPNDGSGRIFVVGVEGTISIVNADGSVQDEPFLDLSSTVALRPGQQGLLGLAFHPNFAENGRFYVDYNNLFKNGALTVSEFSVGEDDPNVADPKTERPLLTIDKPYPQHNGGTLRFGPDGYLYIATGDGGWQGDPYDNAQSRFSLLGKILRIDVDAGASGQPYGIPDDNPFNGPGRYDSPYPASPPNDGESRGRGDRRDIDSISPENRKNLSPVRKEIWALGFRNPWQFSFDPQTGDFYVGDVGSGDWEEIDFQAASSTAGQNYGWDWLEASHCFPPEVEDCSRGQVGILPVAEYQHGEDGCAVIGLGVYRGDAYPDLDGIFFSGDYCTGEIRGLQRDGEGTWQFQNLLDTALQPTGAGQDVNGDLYIAMVTSRRDAAEGGNGTIWKLVAADAAPDGAATVPLGEPAGGDVIVDDDGEMEAAPAPDAATEQDAAPEPQSDPADATPATTPDSETATVSTEVVVVMGDLFFEPKQIDVRANTDVRLVFENQGAVLHNFELRDVDVSVDVAPGERGEAVVNLPPGNYRLLCNVPGHKQAGMTGVLMVRE